jgi:hypothetical protein
MASMSDSMIERIARVIAFRFRSGKPFDELPPPAQLSLREDARAILHAMREPSIMMHGGMWDYAYGHMSDPFEMSPKYVLQIWEKGIDAALADNNDPEAVASAHDNLVAAQKSFET